MKMTDANQDITNIDDRVEIGIEPNMEELQMRHLSLHIEEQFIINGDDVADYDQIAQELESVHDVLENISGVPVDEDSVIAELSRRIAENESAVSDDSYESPSSSDETDEEYINTPISRSQSPLQSMSVFASSPGSTPSVPPNTPVQSDNNINTDSATPSRSRTYS